MTAQLIAQITNLPYATLNFDQLKALILDLSIIPKAKIITITGTNGKGSTVALLSHIFKHHCVDFISHTSPHLHTFNERITHNNKPIANSQLIQYLNFIKPLCIKRQCALNYYQVAFVCTLLHAQYLKPKWLILEVGIGGMKDPANCLDADFAILTHVGLDHCEILGNSIEQIAFDKVHIARKGKPMILGEQIPQRALEYLSDIKANTLLAPPHHLAYKKINTPASSFNCALTLIEAINQQTNTTLSIPPSIASLQVKGRFSQLSKHPIVIADVAHNLAAVTNLFDNIQQSYLLKNRRLFALYATQPGKDIATIIQFATPFIDQWLLPNLSKLDQRFLAPQDNIAQHLPKHNYQIFEQLKQCQNQLVNLVKKDDILIIFGAFILVGEMILHYEK